MRSGLDCIPPRGGRRPLQAMFVPFVDPGSAPTRRLFRLATKARESETFRCSRITKCDSVRRRYFASRAECTWTDSGRRLLLLLPPPLRNRRHPQLESRLKPSRLRSPLHSSVFRETGAFHIRLYDSTSLWSDRFITR